jgi:Mrp family chromosome partitioning ATPase
MSQIFDGLQRSEAERSGGQPSVLPRATEILRRAELRAASKWESTAVLEPPDAPRVAASTAAEAQPAPVDEPIDPFEQFQSLQVTLTPQSRLVCLTDSGSPAAEAFRLLGLRLRHRRRDGAIKKVLITSTIPQEGKSMVAGNLACALAQKTDQRVLLLEGDLRRPSLSQIFGLGKRPGLNECLRGEQPLAASIYHLEEAGL